MIVAEGRTWTGAKLWRRRLQWGRNLIVAEGWGHFDPDRWEWGFNGAAT